MPLFFFFSFVSSLTLLLAGIILLLTSIIRKGNLYFFPLLLSGLLAIKLILDNTINTIQSDLSGNNFNLNIILLIFGNILTVIMVYASVYSILPVLKIGKTKLFQFNFMLFFISGFLLISMPVILMNINPQSYPVIPASNLYKILSLSGSLYILIHLFLYRKKVKLSRILPDILFRIGYILSFGMIINPVSRTVLLQEKSANSGWFYLQFLFTALWGLYIIRKHFPAHSSEPVIPETVPVLFITQYGLSGRETEIIPLLIKGKSNAEIAEILFISSHTLKNHIYNIYKKTSVKNRLDLIRILQSNP